MPTVNMYGFRNAHGRLDVLPYTYYRTDAVTQHPFGPATLNLEPCYGKGCLVSSQNMHH